MTISCEFREEFWNLKHGIWVRRQCRVIHLSHYALRVPRDYANEELHEKKHFVWCTSFLIYMKQLALLGCHVELYKWHRIESSYIVWRVVVWYSEPLRFFLLGGQVTAEAMFLIVASIGIKKLHLDKGQDLEHRLKACLKLSSFKPDTFVSWPF